MNIVILSARTGWHTDELCRALQERGRGTVAGRPGAMWDGRKGTANAGSRSLQLYSGDVTNVG